MKIFFSPYELTFNNVPNSRASHDFIRKGALLKVNWPGVGVGYSDFHPLTEFGEPGTKDQFDQFCKGKTSVRMERSLFLSKWEALYRKEKKRLHLDQPIESHYLVSELCSLNQEKPWLKGYNTIKVKMGRNIKEEMDQLLFWMETGPGEIKWRLDFNEFFKDQFSEFEKWLLNYSTLLKEKIEFIEDPTFYDKELWRVWSNRFQIHFALDMASDPREVDLDGLSFLVVKPAWLDLEKVLEKAPKACQFVFTHSMDHPIGQYMAKLVAYEYQKQLLHRFSVGGLEDFCQIQTSDFSREVWEDSLQDPSGSFGLGVDHLMDELSWQPLI